MANRSRIIERRRQQKRKSIIISASIAAGIIGFLGLIIWNEIKPGIGDKIPIAPAIHIDYGLPAVSPSDPPTSGSHYESPMPEGFYTEESPEFLADDHDGYLIHSLEHGYVIFWYNCQILDEQSCVELKSEIRMVMDELNGMKLIAFPRLSISVPLIMTSWGQLQEFPEFDKELAKEFIKVNQPRAPEANAP